MIKLQVISKLKYSIVEFNKVLENKFTLYRGGLVGIEPTRCRV